MHRAGDYRAQLQNYREAITQLLGLPGDRIATTLLFTKLPLAIELEPPE